MQFGVFLFFGDPLGQGANAANDKSEREVAVRDAEVSSAGRIVERNKRRTEMHLAQYVVWAVAIRARAGGKWRSGAMRLAIPMMEAS